MQTPNKYKVCLTCDKNHFSVFEECLHLPLVYNYSKLVLVGSGLKGLMVLVFWYGVALLPFRSLAATDPERSRILIHSLNYISQDYKYSVENGQVKNPNEYAEQQEFLQTITKNYQQFSGLWNKGDSAQIGLAIDSLVTMIEQKAAYSIVSTQAISIKDRIIRISGLKLVPNHYPDLKKGKALFQANCAKCHGETGLGDGKEGEKLNPRPFNFMNEEKMRTLSPSFAFNTIRLGVQGTGMKAFSTLTDEEIWNLSFFVIGLRHQKKASESKLNVEGILGALNPAASFELLAEKSDLELSKSYKEEAITALRLNQPDGGKNQYLDLALQYLEETLNSYKDGNKENAARLAAMAYLEGIEPVEMQIKASEPALSDHIEQQFMNIRKMIADKRDFHSLKDSVATIRQTVAQASNLLNGKKYSFWMAFLLTISILLREGLEAFLVIMVMLSVLNAAGLKQVKWWVHGGWIGAVALGCVLWLGAGELIRAASGKMELVEGFISLFAVGMLLYVGFWLHGRSEAAQWKQYVENMVNKALLRKSFMGLAGLSFLIVFREVFESLLFLSALNIESGGKQSHGILIGVVTAFAIVIGFAIVVLKFSTRLPIPKLFKISSIAMAVLAVVLMGKGIHSLQETGMLGINGLPFAYKSDFLGIYPTAQSFGAQVLLTVFIYFVWKWKMKSK